MFLRYVQKTAARVAGLSAPNTVNRAACVTGVTAAAAVVYTTATASATAFATANAYQGHAVGKDDHPDVAQRIVASAKELNCDSADTNLMLVSVFLYNKSTQQFQQVKVCVSSGSCVNFVDPDFCIDIAPVEEKVFFEGKQPIKVSECGLAVMLVWTSEPNTAVKLRAYPRKFRPDTGIVMCISMSAAVALGLLPASVCHDCNTSTSELPCLNDSRNYMPRSLV
jgi:hypothetical protein